MGDDLGLLRRLAQDRQEIVGEAHAGARIVEIRRVKPECQQKNKGYQSLPPSFVILTPAAEPLYCTATA
jgi:hypothetical protein